MGAMNVVFSRWLTSIASVLSSFSRINILTIHSSSLILTNDDEERRGRLCRLECQSLSQVHLLTAVSFFLLPLACFDGSQCIENGKYRRRCALAPLRYRSDLRPWRQLSRSCKTLVCLLTFSFSCWTKSFLAVSGLGRSALLDEDTRFWESDTSGTRFDSFHLYSGGCGIERPIQSQLIGTATIGFEQPSSSSSLVVRRPGRRAIDDLDRTEPNAQSNTSSADHQHGGIDAQADEWLANTFLTQDGGHLLRQCWWTRKDVEISRSDQRMFL